MTNTGGVFRGGRQGQHYNPGRVAAVDYNIRYKDRQVDPEILLAFMVRTLTRPTGGKLAFTPFESPEITKESVGVINLAIREGKLCFLLGKRTERASDLQGFYALPTGKMEAIRPSAYDLVSLHELRNRGLVKEEEYKREDKETIVQAALRENREESGLNVYPTEIIGRIEFQGAKPEVRVVAFVADASRFDWRSRSGELGEFQWVPIDVLIESSPEDAGQKMQKYLGAEAQLMKGLLLRGMQTFKLWLEGQIERTPDLHYSGISLPPDA